MGCSWFEIQYWISFRSNTILNIPLRMKLLRNLKCEITTFVNILRNSSKSFSHHLHSNCTRVECSLLTNYRPILFAIISENSIEMKYWYDIVWYYGNSDDFTGYEVIHYSPRILNVPRFQWYNNCGFRNNLAIYRGTGSQTIEREREIAKISINCSLIQCQMPKQKLINWSWRLHPLNFIYYLRMHSSENISIYWFCNQTLLLVH